MEPSAIILLFVKAPVRGTVKSRLAAALGDAAVLDLYRSFVLDTLTTVDSTGASNAICYHPPEAEKEVKSWLGSERSYLPQKGKDVGERMEQAFRETFSRGFSRAVLIGSDIPDLPGSVLVEAMKALAKNDAVIGPAADGGYYLIGFRNDTFLPEVFHGMPWSTARVFDMTMEVLRRAGRAVRQLPLWRDVDTLDDLRDLMTRNRNNTSPAGRTMKQLEISKHRFLSFLSMEVPRA